MTFQFPDFPLSPIQGIKIAGRNINNADDIITYADDTTLMAESEEELKSLLMKMKEESKKADLKLNIQKPKIMASGPITSWQINGEKMETVTYFIFLGSKITADLKLTSAMKLKDTFRKCCVLVFQWCPTLCNPMDCSLPGSSVHGILQARILE